MSQTYPRYGARDFERRWQTRLNTPPRQTTNNASQLHVEVTHRFPAPNRYGWELRPVAGLSVEESRVPISTRATWPSLARITRCWSGTGCTGVGVRPHPFPAATAEPVARATPVALDIFHRPAQLAPHPRAAHFDMTDEVIELLLLRRTSSEMAQSDRYCAATECPLSKV
jgi:hypothetical protein